MKALTLALSLLCLTAQADVLGIDVASIHEHPGMNGVNPGLYLRKDNGLSAGVYYNSERRLSTWAGYTVHDDADRFAITLGAVTGYKECPICPLVIPSVRFGLTDATSVRLSLAAAKRNPAIHLSLETKF